MAKPYHGRGNPPYYVPTAMLADVLSPLVHELGEDVVHEHADGTVEEVRLGGIERISRRVPHIIDGIIEHSVPRRLWSILYHETMRTGTEMADGILLACDVSITRDTNLPTFPAHHAAAREMIEIHNESTDSPVENIGKMERTLVNFCKGFCTGLHVDADELLEMEAAKLAVGFIRELSKETPSGSRPKALVAA